MNLDYPTKKNNERIRQLVEENFSLTTESRELFMSYLNDPLRRKSPEFDEVYRQPDLRIRFPLTQDFIQELDEQWGVFQKIFRSFCEELNVVYQNFTSGLIAMGKNQYKIKRALLLFYSDPKNIISTKRDIRDIAIRRRRNQIYGKTELFAYYRQDFPFIGDNENNDYSWSHGEINNEVEIREYLVAKKLRIGNSGKRCIQNFIEEHLYDINNKKIPFNANKSYEVVITANYADWFLCSTAESWGSCTNMESSYSQAYWFGQPSVIGDRNRIMIYITDGRQKEYCGIRIDRIIARSWIHLVFTPDNRLNYFINQGYPNQHHQLYIKILEKWAKERSIGIFHGEYRTIPGNQIYQTKYPIPFFWHDVLNKDNDNFPSEMIVDCATYIDNGWKYLLDKNHFGITNNTKKFRPITGSGFYCYKDNYDGEICALPEGRFNYTRGLSYLKKEYYSARDLFRLG